MPKMLIKSGSQAGEVVEMNHIEAENAEATGFAERVIEAVVQAVADVVVDAVRKVVAPHKHGRKQD